MVIKFSKFVVIEINGANVNCTLPGVHISKFAAVTMNVGVFAVFLLEIFGYSVYIGSVWSLVECVDTVTAPQHYCACGCCIPEPDDVRYVFNLKSLFYKQYIIK